MARARFFCFLVLLFSSFSRFLPAQEDTNAPDVAIKETDSKQSEILKLDIMTARLSELALWCRELGLSEAGSVNELRQRLLAHFSIKDTGVSPKNDSEKTVVIESARKTEYFTLESVNEEYARLTGDVAVVFTDGKETHRIEAEELIYNKTANTLHARGSVFYYRESESGTETFRGSALEVDLDNWNGIFIGGSNERTQKGDSQSYRFTADSISRTEDNVTILDEATIENAESDEAYWSLVADKIWLMPGSDWAVRNATLRVGNIPVFYLPFFYYPADKLFMNPVFGYRKREGGFFQTTTYLIGQSTAKSENESSVMKILEGNDDTTLKREGLFLVKTEKKREKSGKQLAFLFDVYSNLGSYIGAEANFPKAGIVGETSFSGGIAFSRTLSLLNGNYSPFISGTTESDWNSSRFFSLDVPFRYRFKSNGSFVFENLTLNWTFPYYSDVYIDQDFMNRSEKMDWFNMMKSGAASLQESETIGTLGSYNWRINASGIRLDTKKMSPWVETASVSSLSSSLTFNSKGDPALSTSYSPSRTFFYPSSFNLLNFAMSFSGKPLSTKSENKGGNEDVESLRFPAGSDGVMGFSPWKDSDSEQETSLPDEPFKVSMAPLSTSFATSSSKGTRTEISYSISPSYSNDLNFKSESWIESTDIDWSDVASLFNVAKLNTTLTGKVSAPSDLVTASLVFSGAGVWQSYLYTNSEAAAFDTEAERESELLRNYRATLFNTNATLTLTGKPLVFNSIFSNTKLSYSLKSLLAKSDFVGTALLPEWDILTPEWDSDSITSHSLALDLQALLYDKSQTLSFNAFLPPLDSKISSKLSVNWWKAVTTADMSITDYDTDDITFEPITLTQRFTFNSESSLYQSLILDPESSELTQAVTTFAYKSLTGSFTALKAFPYTFNLASGWTQDKTAEEVIRPKAFSLAWTLKKDVKNAWKDRLSASINASSSLSLDFLRFTQSSFIFTLSSSLKINDFLEFSVSSRSQNAVLFRYIPEFMYGLLPPTFADIISSSNLQTNIFSDLARSFFFWDTDARKKSGFKLKSFSASLKHYMGDWNATLSYTLSPYLDRTQRKYLFDNQIAFLVQWIPFNEFKAETYEDKDGLLFK